MSSSSKSTGAGAAGASGTSSFSSKRSVTVGEFVLLGQAGSSCTYGSISPRDLEALLAGKFCPTNLGLPRPTNPEDATTTCFQLAARYSLNLSAEELEKMFNLAPEQGIIVKILTFKQTAFAMIVIMKKQNILLTFVKLGHSEIATESNKSAKYEAKVSVKTRKGPSSGYSWSGAVDEIRTSTQSILDSGSFIQIPKRVLKNKFEFNTPLGKFWRTDVELYEIDGIGKRSKRMLYLIPVPFQYLDAFNFQTLYCYIPPGQNPSTNANNKTFGCTPETLERAHQLKTIMNQLQLGPGVGFTIKVARGLGSGEPEYVDMEWLKNYAKSQGQNNKKSSIMLRKEIGIGENQDAKGAGGLTPMEELSEDDKIKLKNYLGVVKSADTNLGTILESESEESGKPFTFTFTNENQSEFTESVITPDVVELLISCLEVESKPEVEESSELEKESRGSPNESEGSTEIPNVEKVDLYHVHELEDENATELMETIAERDEDEMDKDQEVGAGDEFGIESESEVTREFEKFVCGPGSKPEESSALEEESGACESEGSTEITEVEKVDYELEVQNEAELMETVAEHGESEMDKDQEVRAGDEVGLIAEVVVVPPETKIDDVQAGAGTLTGEKEEVDRGSFAAFFGTLRFFKLC